MWRAAPATNRRRRRRHRQPRRPATAGAQGGPTIADYVRDSHITALYSKLTGDVDPAKIIQYAPNELLGLPGYPGSGNGRAATLPGFQAWQLKGTYQRDGNTRAVAQKTVVISSQGAVFVLQLNADSPPSDEGPSPDATNIIDDKTTITP